MNDGKALPAQLVLLVVGMHCLLQGSRTSCLAHGSVLMHGLTVSAPPVVTGTDGLVAGLTAPNAGVAHLYGFMHACIVGVRVEPGLMLRL